MTEKLSLRMPSAEAPLRGHTRHGSTGVLEATSAWIERAGKPWFPITGEIHYSRIPRRHWDHVLGMARAGGLNSVASYVFWRIHEPRQGHFMWDGQRDLRAWVETAARHGLDVVIRMGPWAHGEKRYGGLPDWLMALTHESAELSQPIRIRTNDQRYLQHVTRFYSETARQLEGLTLADGGPVIAAQIENELFDGPDHLQMLRRIAEDSGVDVPLWTATGWGGAEIPDALLPVYSAYADGFWAEADQEKPDFTQGHFGFQEHRDDFFTGADIRADREPASSDLDPKGGSRNVSGTAPVMSTRQTPFITCELGAGMHVAYHRRPRVSPAAVAALALAKIGSGSVWQGYYMYAGGTNPTLGGPHQESHATDYPNDVPQLSYDFYAPIGEHGQIREHFHLLRRQHMWLASEGDRIARMTTTLGSEAQEELQWAVRSEGESGYLFFSRYDPHRGLMDPAAGDAETPRVQFTIHQENTTLTLPREPVEIPADVYSAWPLRYRLTEALVLRYATAEFVGRVQRATEPDLVVLCALKEIPVEVVLDDGTEEGQLLQLPCSPGRECRIRLSEVEILILDEATADQVYLVPATHGTSQRMVLSEHPVYKDPLGERLLRMRSGEPLVLLRDAALPAVAPELTRGGSHHRLSAPVDYTTAARLDLVIPPEVFEHAERVLLRVEMTADVGRVWAGATMISDHFWHGRLWEVDLLDHREAMLSPAGHYVVTLELLPWRPSTGVWVHPEVRDAPEGVHLQCVSVVPIFKESAPCDTQDESVLSTDAFQWESCS